MSDKIRVLIVDDEDQFRLTTKKILDRRGFETILAASGIEALERLAGKPDVVVLDIKMPGQDGHQVLSQIRAKAPELPVIMLTGHGTEDSAKTAHGLGAFDYLSKPCDIDVLALKIREAHRHGQPAHQVFERESTVREVMIPLEDYTLLPATATVAEAVQALRQSFSAKAATGTLMETGHRSLLVTGAGGRVIGILAIVNILRTIMPEYLSAPKPTLADSIQFSPIFWQGMFSRELRAILDRPIGELMSPHPLTVDQDASLMEAAYLMVQNNVRRLAVVSGPNVVGVIREQDLFFEMERQIPAR